VAGARGFRLALGYAVAGLIMFVLIITILFAIQSFKLAGCSLWPIGRVMVNQERGSEGLSTIGKVIWVLLAGIWLALGHLLSGLFLAITIIGIPFAVAHVKLAGTALTPFGRSVISSNQAEASGQQVAVSVQPLC
jgi:uncharacterized membrane protein YccF (DUF307 family)